MTSKHPNYGIEYGEILKALNKKPEENRAIENELKSLAEIDYYLAAG